MASYLRGLPGKDRTTEGEDSWASSGNGCSTAAGTAGRPDDEDRRRWLRAYSRHEETPRHLILELNEAGDDYRVYTAPPTGESLETWQVLRSVLLDANQPLTQREILSDWPEDFAKPNVGTISRGSGYRLWQVGSWREVASLGGAGYSTPYCAFTSDDELLALQDQPGVIRLVIPDTGREIARLAIAGAIRLRPLCFTQDGTQLAALGDETMDLYLFDLRTIRRELQKLDLDWDAPALPPAPEIPARPTHWVVEMADFLKREEADQLADDAKELARDKRYSDALDALRQAIQIDPTHARAHNDLARALLTGHKELRDAKAALPLARKAVELAPGQYLYHNTLGIALYRSAAFQAAIPVLDRSLANGKGAADPFDLFFLAMCHHQLGDEAKARDCYDRASKWLDARRAGLSPAWAAELTEFEAEARSLLAVQEVSPKKKQ